MIKVKFVLNLYSRKGLTWLPSIINYLKIETVSWHIFSLVPFKKDAAYKNPCLKELEGIKQKKEDISDLFLNWLP